MKTVRICEGTCYCAPSGDFSCAAPAQAGCPAARPRAGTACSAPCTTWGTFHPKGKLEYGKTYTITVDQLTAGSAVLTAAGSAQGWLGWSP